MSEYVFPRWCEICGVTGFLSRKYDTITINFKGDDFTKSVKEKE